MGIEEIEVVFQNDQNRILFGFMWQNITTLLALPHLFEIEEKLLTSTMVPNLAVREWQTRQDKVRPTS